MVWMHNSKEQGSPMIPFLTIGKFAHKRTRPLLLRGMLNAGT